VAVERLNSSVPASESMLHVSGVVESAAVFPETVRLQEQPLPSVNVNPEAVGWNDQEIDFEFVCAPASPHVTVVISEPLQGAPTKLASGLLELPLLLAELPLDPELELELGAAGTSHRKTLFASRPF
jgi:hypothetical protein